MAGSMWDKVHLKKSYNSKKSNHMLGRSERPAGADFIKTNIVGIDFILAKWSGDFRNIVNFQIHSD